MPELIDYVTKHLQEATGLKDREKLTNAAEAVISEVSTETAAEVATEAATEASAEASAEAASEARAEAAR